MNLQDYKNEYGVKGLKDLAHKCETAYEYLYQIETNRARPGIKMLEKLICHSNGLLTREDLRPDVYTNE